MYTASKLPDKKFIFWEGYCPTHMKILPQHIEKARQQHPGALVMVHPECRPESIAVADAVLSTSGMEIFARESKATEFIVGTEAGMVYRLAKDNPRKKFYPANEMAVCPNMKLTTLEKIIWSLEDMKTQVKVPKEIADKARGCIEKMLKVGRKD
jgi:quinolinate synthase